MFLVLRIGISIHTPGGFLFEELGLHVYSMDSFIVEQSIRILTPHPKSEH